MQLAVYDPAKWQGPFHFHYNEMQLAKRALQLHNIHLVALLWKKLKSDSLHVYN